jgi:hypothetical protein
MLKLLRVPVRLAASVAVMTIPEEVPADVGVPLTKQVELLSVSPAGNVPEVTA